MVHPLDLFKMKWVSIRLTLPACSDTRSIEQISKNRKNSQYLTVQRQMPRAVKTRPNVNRSSLRLGHVYSVSSTTHRKRSCDGLAQVSSNVSPVTCPGARIDNASGGRLSL